MLLYVLRHGIAEDASPTGADADRPLTEDGVKRTRKVLEALADRIAKKDRPQLVLTSPLVRARQTAELAAAVFDINLDDWPVLGENEAKAILPVLDELAEVPAAMIVGHEPSLSDLIEKLCDAAPGSVQLKKAGCALLDVPYDDFGQRAGGPATLLWLITPRLMA